LMSTSLESAASQGISPSTAPEPTQQKIGFRRKAKAYLALTKPRVIELLLVTTLPTMIFAYRGWPDLWTVLATMVGVHWPLALQARLTVISIAISIDI